MSQLNQIKTDKDILDLATMGDSEAQATVAERYRPAVESHIRFHRIAQQDREDLTQDVMLDLVRLMRVGKVLEIKVSFRALLRKIIERRALDAQRKRSRHPDWQPIGGTDHQNRLAEHRGGEAFVDIVIRLMADPKLRDLVVMRLEAVVTPRQFQAFRLACDVPRWEVFPSQAEVAATMGIAEGALSIALQRAKREFVAIVMDETGRGAS